MRRILAEQTVSVTELRKNPAQYFIDEPVVVLSKNKPVGYMISAKLFENIVDMLGKQPAYNQLQMKNAIDNAPNVLIE
jgi:Phd_YefM.